MIEVALRIAPITLRQARAFVQEHHRHHDKPQGGLCSTVTTPGGHAVTNAPAITFPAPTADWGTMVVFAIPIDRRTPRTTPKDIRLYRYVRHYYRRRLMQAGMDSGRWFRGILIVQVDKEARRRAREALS